MSANDGKYPSDIPDPQSQSLSQKVLNQILTRDEDMVYVKQEGEMAAPSTCAGERRSWLGHLSTGEGYSQTDYLRLRNLLVQVIEEVKLRRETDVENEERIQQLVRQKHELESRCDSEASKSSNEKQRHAEQIRDVHRQYEEKVRQMQEEKSRQQVCGENIEKETKALRDEVRNLQLQKYSLEKQLHEQSSKLQLQMSAAEKYLSQLSTLEQKFSGVAKQYSLVIGSQGRLDKNVEEAVRLNRRLTYVNEHQKCLVSQYKEEVEMIKHQLLDARVRLQSQPAQTGQLQKQLELRADQLQTLLKQKTKEAENSRKELGELQARYEICHAELKESHNLIERHLVVVEKHRKCCEQLEAEKQNLLTELIDLRSQLKTRSDLLVEEKESHKQAREEWHTQEEGLKGELEEAVSQLKESGVDRERLEELNTAWAQKNLQLTKDLDTAKAILDVEKTDVEIQAEVENRQTESQTDRVECIPQGVQVSSVLITASTQTLQGGSAAKDTQTAIVTSGTFTSQVHLCCGGEISMIISPPDENIDGAEANKTSEGDQSSGKSSSCCQDIASSQHIPTKSTEISPEFEEKSSSRDSLKSSLFTVSKLSTALPSLTAFKPIGDLRVAESERLVTSDVRPHLSQVISPDVNRVTSPGVFGLNKKAFSPAARSSITSCLYPLGRNGADSFPRSGSLSHHTTTVLGRKSFALNLPVPSSPAYSQHQNTAAGISRFPLKKDTTSTTNVLGLKSSTVASDEKEYENTVWKPLRTSAAFCNVFQERPSELVQSIALSGETESASCQTLAEMKSNDAESVKRQCHLGVSGFARPSEFTRKEDLLGIQPSLGSHEPSQLITQSGDVPLPGKLSTCRQMTFTADLSTYQDTRSKPQPEVLDKKREEDVVLELSPYSRYSSQLRQSSQEIRYIPEPVHTPASGAPRLPSLQFCTSQSDPPGTNVGTLVHVTGDKGCKLSACTEGMRHSPLKGMRHSPLKGMRHSPLKGMRHSPLKGMRHSPLKGILRDSCDAIKRQNKAVRFSDVQSSEVTSPHKVACMDGDEPLFSDTDDEPMELGSRMENIEAILSSDKLTTGRKRKRTDHK